jgi:prepilin-type N-terminal cleavage/methylation domain-containing protein
MPKRAGFTLVELLVVMAIISLLIGIVAPSLNAAKDLAKQSYCQTTMDALNKSTLVYAEMSRGYVMVFTHKYRAGYIEGPHSPYQTYCCFKVGAIDTATGVYSDARNLGLVYKQKILTKPEMYYCAAQKDPIHTLSYYPKPWGTSVPPGHATKSDFIRNSIMWDPWVIVNPADAKYVTYEHKLLLERHRSDRYITGDIADGASRMCHTQGNTATWNQGFPDGHVAPFDSKELFIKFSDPINMEVGNFWGDFQIEILSIFCPGYEAPIEKGWRPGSVG